MTKFKKRFIAGAVCPQCQLADKTMVYDLAGKSFTECVRCGFKQVSEVDSVERAGNKKIIWLANEKTEK